MNSYYCDVNAVAYIVNEVIDCLLLLILMILIYFQIVSNIEIPPALARFAHELKDTHRYVGFLSLVMNA